MNSIFGLMATSGENFVSIAHLEIPLLIKMLMCQILIFPAVVMLGNLQNILIDHNLYLIFYNDVRHKRNIDNIDPYNLLLEIASNIPVQLKKTVFLVRGHICNYFVAGNVSM